MRLAAAVLAGCVSLWAQGDVAAVLQKNCLGCHGAAAMSGLDLRSREGMLKGGTRGPAVLPGQAKDSLLYALVSGAKKPAMPPAGLLKPEEVAAIERWINAGAPELTLSPAPKYWAFVPPVHRNYEGNAIDQFFPSAKMADARTLVRRAYLDLLGLPPTPAQVEEFVRNPDWPKLVDRLLASPHYGERWARHWLDLVRYADSAGYEFDRDRPTAWRFRDYVVNSLNADKPYDQFIREQLAGDESANPGPEQFIATGYLRHGPEANIRTDQTRLDELDDLIATTSGAFLGLTVGCARCHDHKFDPIPQKDYFKLQAVFYNTEYASHPLTDAAAIAANVAENKRIDQLQKPAKQALLDFMKPTRDRLTEAKRASLPEYMQLAVRTPAAQRTEGQALNAKQVEVTLKTSDEDVIKQFSAEEKARHKELVAAVEAFDKLRPPDYPAALGIKNGKKYSPDHQPGVLSAPALPAPSFGPDHLRTTLANWIASPENPLTARVMVNRIFLQHFGEAFVDTPSNFGKSGSGVKKQELLDWLATEFMRSGWSLKSLHRLILTSRYYQSQLRPRRLEAEIVRDSILATAGTLDRTMGGSGVHPFIDPTLWQGSSGRKWPGKSDEDPSTWRRGIYVFTKRTIPVPMMEVYDKPDTVASCARRNRSTTSIQALIMMNGSFVDVQSRKFAERLSREAATPEEQVKLGFALALGRSPTAKETSAALSFLQSNSTGLVDFCQTLFNLNEFAYIP
ncbi:MAG: PSD1 and planctomycete cytochrome C domain-containing protein [Bryobacteraceae bacterium]|nr:PSD1 and planctomycete cytochrome C domain-containing protein [Bryobacteraceae bacterium]